MAIYGALIPTLYNRLMVPEKNPVNQFTLDGNFVKRYPSVRVAFEENEYGDINAIYRCAGGGNTQAYGYVWVYDKDLDGFVFPKQFFGKNIPVVRYSVDGNYIDEFSGKKKAARETGCSLWKINHSLEDPNYSWNGYVWRLKTGDGVA